MIDVSTTEFKPVELTAEDLKRCRYSYDAERLAAARFEAANPYPVKPDAPEPVQTTPPQVIKHRREGGLWLEVKPGGIGSFGPPHPPAVEMTLVMGSEVVQITMTSVQFEQFKNEVHRVEGVVGLDQARFESWQDEQATFEDAKSAYSKALNRARNDAETAWYAANPDADDDDDF